MTTNYPNIPPKPIKRIVGGDIDNPDWGFSPTSTGEFF